MDSPEDSSSIANPRLYLRAIKMRADVSKGLLFNHKE